MADVSRTDRISAEMKREISNIIQELKDPRLNGLLVSVTRCEVTNDLRHAKVLVSIFGGDEDKCRKCYDAIVNASGFIRREAGARVKLRVTPELHFTRDDSIEYGVRMTHYIDEILGNAEKKDAE